MCVANRDFTREFTVVDCFELRVDLRHAFRCAIAPEDSGGTLNLGARSVALGGRARDPSKARSERRHRKAASIDDRARCSESRARSRISRIESAVDGRRPARGSRRLISAIRSNPSFARPSTGVASVTARKSAFSASVAVRAALSRSDNSSTSVGVGRGSKTPRPPSKLYAAGRSWRMRRPGSSARRSKVAR